ncbi:MAG: ABC transporter permease [Steroidobacteraceae bacterium]
MFKNYLAAALRNLARNRLYAVINIIGLSVGFAATILIALFIRSEFSYENFIPNRDRTYLVTETIASPGAKPIVASNSPAELAAWLKADFPFIEAVTRLNSQRTTLRHQDVEAIEEIYWADPNFFEVISLPAIAGDPRTALQQPDGIVLTKRIARKYFGRDNVVGETLEIGRAHSMRVTAVLEDLPVNTHLDTEILASGTASFSLLTEADSRSAPLSNGNNNADSKTYIRLRQGTAVEELSTAMPAFIARHARTQNFSVSFPMYPLSSIHLYASASMSNTRMSGSLSVIYAVSAIGVLILLVAAINFVNLMTARATRRSLEVGVRKSSGALRRDLIVQFIGESMLYAALSMLLAITLVELALPAFNAFLGQTIRFDYWQQPLLLALLLLLTFGTGALAGLYPALVLSAFSPIGILKNDRMGSGRVRYILVTCQFAVLIGLIISTALIYQQTRYATTEALRLNQDQMLGVETACKSGFKDAVIALPGVQSAACTFSVPTLPATIQNFVTLDDGRQIWVWNTFVDIGFFETFDLKPLAGRFFSEKYGSDMMQRNASANSDSVIVNETLVRALNVSSATAAIGQTFRCGPRKCEIIGVVPDYAEDSVRELIRPMLYRYDPNQFRVLAIKLRGQDVPETLRAIDQLWSQLGDARPISRVFLNERIQLLYQDITRQSQLFTLFSTIALCIACLSVFGLAAFTAERRTKEIGVRKAMGAGTSEVMRMLIWQFARPVLWANLIAWPVAGYCMSRWLGGFAYHIELQPWLFAAASMVALVIALLTVSVHCYLVARAKPVTALRYE